MEKYQFEILDFHIEDAKHHNITLKELIEYATRRFFHIKSNENCISWLCRKRNFDNNGWIYRIYPNIQPKYILDEKELEYVMSYFKDGWEINEEFTITNIALITNQEAKTLLKNAK